MEDETWLQRWMRNSEEESRRLKSLEPWFRAVRDGDVETVRGLLRQGIDVDARGRLRETALIDAIRCDRLPLVRILLDHGASLDVEDSYGYSPMTYALDYSHPEIRSETIAMLREAGGRFGLREAVSLNDVELARQRLEEGANPNTGEGKYHGPLLMIAAEKGLLDIVNLLLDYGAKVDAMDDLAQRPLVCAAESGYLDVVSVLLDRGADIDAQDSSSRSALAAAAARDHREVVAFLLARGAERGLIDAVALGGEELVREELEDRSDIDRPFYGSERLALLAAGRGNVAILRMLLDCGAAHYAERDDRSLLAEAARWGHVGIARLLIDRGADLHDVGEEDLTPLDWARKEGHDEMIALLERAGATR